MLHPLGLGALALNVDPMEWGVVVLVESLVLTVPVMWWRPPEVPSTTPPSRPEPELTLDGFTVHWPSRPLWRQDSADTAAFIVAFYCALAAVVWIPIGLFLNPHVANEFLVLFAGLLGAPLGVAQFLVGWMQRVFLNLLRRGGVTTVTLRGRQLRVDEEEWIRQHEDEVVREPGALWLRRGSERLRIPGGEGSLAWLHQQLFDTQPDPGGEVPAALAQLRDSAAAEE